MKPVVAIVGRPNVGKSSLFNRMLRRRKALVEDRPGVTRDRNYALCEHGDRAFLLVDTGGFDSPGSHDLAREVRDQALLAVEEAQVIVLLMDARAGVTPLDEELAARLRKVKQPVLYAVNKVDHPSVLAETWDFHRLGVDEVIPVSAAHGYGVEDLLDRVVEELPAVGRSRSVPEPWEGEGTKRKPSRREAREKALAERAATHQAWEQLQAPVPTPGEGDDGPPDERVEGWAELIADDDAAELAALADREMEDAIEAYERAGETPGLQPEGEDPGGMEGAPGVTGVPDADGDDFVLRVAVLGRPNVGKSTLVNKLLGYERTIVSDLPGTTRDSVDTRMVRDGREMIVIDTAGIRRKARIADRLEKYSVARAITSLEQCHVALLLVDATEGLTEQEARLAALADDRGRALVICINKWDVIEERAEVRRMLEDTMDRRLPHVRYAKVVTVSARTGKGLSRLWEAIAEVDASHRTRIPTGELNRWLEQAAKDQPPALWRRYPIRFYFAAQIGTRPPAVVVHANRPEGLDENYRRYLMNRFRDHFRLEGTPVKMLFRKRS